MLSTCYGRSCKFETLERNHSRAALRVELRSEWKSHSEEVRVTSLRGGHSGDLTQRGYLNQRMLILLRGGQSGDLAQRRSEWSCSEEVRVETLLNGGTYRVTLLRGGQTLIKGGQSGAALRAKTFLRVETLLRLETLLRVEPHSEWSLDQSEALLRVEPRSDGTMSGWRAQSKSDKSIRNKSNDDGNKWQRIQTKLNCTTSDFDNQKNEIHSNTHHLYVNAPF